MSKLPDVKKLLPHEKPMILLDRIKQVDEESVCCQVEICESNLFFEHDKQAVPAYVGIEFIAQSIAAWSGYHAWTQKKKPSIGFLLGSRRYNTRLSTFQLGMVLDIYAHKVMEGDGMAVFSGKIEHKGETVAECQLNVYVPSDEKLEEMKKAYK